VIREQERERFNGWQGFVIISISVFIFLRFFVDGLSSPFFNFFWNLYFSVLAVVQIIRERMKTPLRREEALLLLFFSFSAISSGISPVKGTGAAFNGQILAYWCILILLARNFTASSARILFHIIIVSGLLITMYGLYQHFWGLEQTRHYVYSRPELLKSLPPTFLDRISSDRIFATFASPNTFASFLLFLIPLSFFPAFSGQKVPTRVLCAGLLLLALYNLMLTGSYGGLLILVFLIQVMLLFLIAGDRRGFRAIVSLLVVFEILLFAAGYHAGNLPKMSSFSDRIGYWNSAVRVFRTQPVLGVGPGNYRYYYTEFKSPSSMEAKHPHSILFASLAETGITGTFFLFAFLLSTASMLFRKSRISPFYAGLAFSFLAFLLHNLIDFNFIDPAVCILFFISGGLVAAIAEKGVSYSRGFLTKPVNCLIIIAVLFTSLDYARFTFSERALVNARMEWDISSKYYYIERAKKLYPDNFEIYGTEGDIFSDILTFRTDLGYEESAENSYRHAIMLNPQFAAAYRKLAFLYENSGRYGLAEEMYLDLLRIYPNKKQYNIEMAVFYMKRGNDKKFRHYYETSRRLNAVTMEEADAVEGYEKWIESQK